MHQKQTSSKFRGKSKIITPSKKQSTRIVLIFFDTPEDLWNNFFKKNYSIPTDCERGQVTQPVCQKTILPLNMDLDGLHITVVLLADKAMLSKHKTFEGKKGLKDCWNCRHWKASSLILNKTFSLNSGDPGTLHPNLWRMHLLLCFSLKVLLSMLQIIV